MKFNAALAKSLLMAASIGVVVPVLAQAPARKAAPKAEEKAAEKKEPTIPGQVITRSNGSFISLTLDGGKFKMAFYDSKKELIAPDVTRATARWNPVNKTGDERTVLNLEGDALKGVKYVQPPYVFKVFFTLLSEDGQAVESFAVDFRG